VTLVLISDSLKQVAYKGHTEHNKVLSGITRATH